MGPRRTVDKTVKPLTTLTNLTPAMVTGGINVNALGNLPLGNYKGALAFWDLDLANNQPNVQAEWQHIMGILDAREEDYDLQTSAIAALAPVAQVATGSLTVPAGEVWYISTVQVFCPALGAGSQAGINWYCSLWTDRVGALGLGQPYHAAETVSALNAGVQLTDEFWYTAPILGIGNKAAQLRLPAGAVISATYAVRTGAAVNTVACTLQLFGYVARPLVA